MQRLFLKSGRYVTLRWQFGHGYRRGWFLGPALRSYVESPGQPQATALRGTNDSDFHQRRKKLLSTFVADFRV